jgi:O-antigen/teichoic acid export membrane protein
MRERYRYLARSALDLTAAIFMQLTLLGAVLLIFALDSLRNVAFFTFALSLCGPISLFAGMSLMELLFSGDERYRNLRQVALAQITAFAVLAGLVGLVVALWDKSYLLIFGIVAIGRAADLMCSLTLHIMRSRGWFRQITLLGVLQFLVFMALAGLSLAIDFAAPYIEISLALMSASIIQAAIAFYWLRDGLRRGEADAPLRPFHFIRSHVFRSVAISLNSVQGNAPRYGLELMVSPQHQAAFSLIYTVSRAGTIFFQSLFVPIVGVFKSTFVTSPRKAVLIATAAFAGLSVVFTLALVGIWLVAIRYGLFNWLGAELRAVLTPAIGVFVLVNSGIYLFRFGIWQIVSLLDSGRRQTFYAIAGLVVTGAGVIALTPRNGIMGASTAEIAGNIVLVALPIFAWLKLGATRRNGINGSKD